jgi:hypothetical protein
MQIPETAHQGKLHRTCVSHPRRSAGHVVRSGESEARNVNALFLTLRWNQCRYHKKCARTRYIELVLLHLV